MTFWKDAETVREEFDDRMGDLVELGVSVIGMEAIRRHLVSKGLTPFAVLMPAVIGAFAASQAGKLIYDDPKDVEKYEEFTNRLYDWYGLEDWGPGRVLSVIPNPLQVVPISWDIGIDFGEHMVSRGGPGRSLWYPLHVAFAEVQWMIDKYDIQPSSTFEEVYGYKFF